MSEQPTELTRVFALMVLEIETVKSLTPAKLSMIMFLGVGLLVAVYFGKRMFATTEKEEEKVTRTIPMTISELEPGTVIKESHIGLGYIDKEKVTPDMLLSNRVIIGRVVKEKLSATSPFRADSLHPPGYRTPLKITSGMRAVAIHLDDAADIVNGAILPGEYVDVHMTVDSSRVTDPMMLRGGLTLTLFRGVKLLAVNSDDSSSAVNRVGNSVTLELTPEQANIMILSEEKGKITLAKNPEGKGSGVVGVDDETRATLDQILGLKTPDQPDAPFITEHFIGTGRRAIMFRREGNRIIRIGANSNRLDDADEELNHRSDSNGGGNISPTRGPLNRPRVGRRSPGIPNTQG